MLLIAVPVLRGDVDGGKELAGIFSGWIAAIVGFYFFQGQAQQAAVAERERATVSLEDLQAYAEALSLENDALKRDLKEALKRLQDYPEDEES